MKRSGFAKPPRKPAKQCTYQPRPRKPAQPVLATDGRARMVVPVPKAQPLRDEDYRRLVASLPCAWCGIYGQSQAAHRNEGKGMGIKASDAELFPLCGPGGLNCHALLDSGGRFNKTERRETEALWANQTRRKLRKLAEHDPAVRKIVERSIGL